MPKDLFSQAPEFLTAFNNILNNGFFEDIKFSVTSIMEGKIFACSITAKGCVPSKEKYKASGCGVVIDPTDVVALCRKLVNQRKVMDISVKVQDSDWPLYDARDEKVIGSKGTHTEMFLYFNIKT